MTNIIKIIEKHIKELHANVEELEQFKETYLKVIPEIKTILVDLFNRDEIKELKTYTMLKNEYHDRILALFNPKNFTQLIVETSLPGIYDAPSERYKKIAVITKIAKDLKKKC